MATSKILSASQCSSMAELRAEIDRLDRALVRLLSERQRYIERAAEIKSQRSDIRDQARVEDVLAKVTAEAEEAGLDPSLARTVWLTLIEQSIELEFAAFDAKAQSGERGP
jgi:isochorismate pyruvate lyase